MLFVQCITLRYMKDVRYANYADQRKAVRFMKLPDVKPEENEDSGFYKTKIIHDTCEYGRIIFNERGAYHTGIWYYDLIIYNFLNAPYSSFNSKIFFRKEPDHEFTDMHYLRYC